jgi:hypothetical protein
MKGFRGEKESKEKLTSVDGIEARMGRRWMR